MYPLLTWRNPHGKEGNWIFQAQVVDHPFNHFGKIITTELALPLLITTALVETISYTALALMSLTIYPCTHRPCPFFAKLLQSASFTIIWGLADAFIYNPLFINITPCEPFARYWADLSCLTPIEIFRKQDRLYIEGWAQKHDIKLPGIIYPE